MDDVIVDFKKVRTERKRVRWGRRRGQDFAGLTDFERALRDAIPYHLDPEGVTKTLLDTAALIAVLSKLDPETTIDLLKQAIAAQQATLEYLEEECGEGGVEDQSSSQHDE